MRKPQWIFLIIVFTFIIAGVVTRFLGMIDISYILMNLSELGFVFFFFLTNIKTIALPLNISTLDF
jgi:hypothetical protein